MELIYNPLYWILWLGILSIAVTLSVICGCFVYFRKDKAGAKSGRSKPVMAIVTAASVFFLVICGFCGYELYREKYDFYGYAGFGDWYRIPLKYPYEVRVIDGGEGSLGKWQEDSAIVTGITGYAVKGSIMVGEIGPTHFHNRPTEWFSFNFDTGELVYYSTEKEFVSACEELGFDGKLELEHP